MWACIHSLSRPGQQIFPCIPYERPLKTRLLRCGTKKDFDAVTDSTVSCVSLLKSGP